MNSSLKPRTLEDSGSAGLETVDAQTEAAPIACQTDWDHDLHNVKQVGRATWVCGDCGKDVSLAYLFYQQALNGYPSDL